MSIVVNAVLPLFALVLLGYAAMRLRLMTEAGLGGLNTFIYFFVTIVVYFITDLYCRWTDKIICIITVSRNSA